MFLYSSQLTPRNSLLATRNMDNGRRNIIILLGVIAVAALVYFALMYQPDTRHNWNELYRHDDDKPKPYSNEVILKLLKGYFPENELEVVDEKRIAEALPVDTTDEAAVSNYVLIGENMFLDSADAKQLLDFVEHGNTAFIASKRMPYQLSEKLYARSCDTLEEARYEETYEECFTHPKLKRDTAYTYQYVYKNKPANYDWHRWIEPDLCDSSAAFIRLGYMEPEAANFVKIPYGEGEFLFHSNPIVFTNYHLLDEDAVAYASSVFSHLQEGDIYWDEKTKDYRFDFPGRDNERFMESPLSYILSQQSLKWAWYLMLTLVLLFVLFRAKRKQRIIPIHAANTNTSLEFIQTIGRLYHQQQDHKNLSEKMMYLFKDFVRRRYGIRLNHYKIRNSRSAGRGNIYAIQPHVA